MMVMLAMRGRERGSAVSSPSRLSASMPLSPASFAWSITRYWMLPCQPSVQSRESSALPVSTTCLAFTAPPKNSTPSSRLLWT